MLKCQKIIANSYLLDFIYSNKKKSLNYGKIGYRIIFIFNTEFKYVVLII